MPTKKTTAPSYISTERTTALGQPSVNIVTASLTCCRVRVVLKSLLEKPSLLRMPSMRKPRLAVDEMVSRHTMYLKRQVEGALSHGWTVGCITQHKYRCVTEFYQIEDAAKIVSIHHRFEASALVRYILAYEGNVSAEHNCQTLYRTKEQKRSGQTNAIKKHMHITRTATA